MTKHPQKIPDFVHRGRVAAADQPHYATTSMVTSAPAYGYAAPPFGGYGYGYGGFGGYGGYGYGNDVGLGLAVGLGMGFGHGCYYDDFCW